MRREKYARDANEPEIIAAFEAMRCNVWPLCAAEPADLLVLIPGAMHHRLRLIEIKDPDKSASERRLTETQRQTHAIWPVHIVETVDHVLSIVAEARGTIRYPNGGRGQ